MFENKNAALVHKSIFYSRLFFYFLFGSALMLFSLALGTFGYVVYAKMEWIDGFLNASMILAGMGPVGTIETFSGKLFSSFYALYCGVAFLSSTAIIFAPIFHRFLHILHLETR